ncbi:MAG: diaminopimelate epimerase [Acetobacter sp.]|nr:diaminopimelate epimerase [Acetobacter sp.]
MRTPFFKMHGLGNDFIIFDERNGSLPLSPTRIAALAHRKRGIGCDQLIILSKPENAQADVFVRFFNADGSEAYACGNGSRCVAAFVSSFVSSQGETLEGGGKKTIQPVLQTRAGLLPTSIRADGLVTVDMGIPKTAWYEIPLAKETDTQCLPIMGDPAAVSMGNPHVTFFVHDFSLLAEGKRLEHHPLFPQRANIGFALVESPNQIRLKVHERGVGLTEACGSAACATVVNAVRRGLTERVCDVLLDGGTLHIRWEEATQHVFMTGPVATPFEGTVDLNAFPS